jgi:hypothetical protein
MDLDRVGQRIGEGLEGVVMDSCDVIAGGEPKPPKPSTPPA